MMRSVAAKRYAQAVFQLALERDELDQWFEDLHQIADVALRPDLFEFFKNVKVPKGEKLRVAKATIFGIAPLAMNLVRLLLSRDRLDLIGEILDAYEAMLDQHRGIEKVEVTTAMPLAPSDEELIEEKLRLITGKQIVMTTRVDPTIIGGLVARIGDKVLDGSTRTRLQSLKKTLAEGKI